ncbi:MAG: sulfurtransferase [Candidatus Binataceae bacterium]
MARLVDMDWVAQRMGQPGIVLVDPRRPMKYLSGHLPDALNVPVYQTFGADGKLLAPDALAGFLGTAGLGGDPTPVLYDSPEGQNAAMLAWILEYLGRTDVCVMASFYEAWKAAGREVRYKPVEAAARTFASQPNPAGRITVEEARAPGRLKFVDFRSPEEFSGERSIGEDQPGHIPGAVNVVWRDLADPPRTLLKPRAAIERILADAGVTRGDQIVAYCRSGPRAALGYLALREAGYEARLFDGSWAEWSRLGLPAEKR